MKISVEKNSIFKTLSHVQSIVEKNNSIPSISYITQDEFSVGTWINYQRNAYKNKKLSQEKISLLEKLPSWKWKFND